MMEFIVVGLLCFISFVGGAVVGQQIIENKVKKGLTPYIDDSGNIAWRK